MEAVLRMTNLFEEFILKIISSQFKRFDRFDVATYMPTNLRVLTEYLRRSASVLPLSLWVAVTGPLPGDSASLITCSWTH